MKKLFIIILVSIFFSLIVIFKAITPYLLLIFNRESINTTKEKSPLEKNNTLEITVVANNLDTPWGIAFLPDGSMLVTERKGTLLHIERNGDSTLVAEIQDAKEVGEGGLLGIALHPEFASNKYVYFYYTYSVDRHNTFNRVVRMQYDNNKLQNMEIIVDRIPGAINHNGGRIAFGPDKFLYITTGDAQQPSLAQSKDSLAGKILRVTDKGEPAPGNPFGNLIFSYGHRNPQGIAWDRKGNLWSTEHGPSGLQSGNDEINRIEPGKNYGWPIIQGTEELEDMVTPVATSGVTTTWAPASAAIIGDVLFFGGLRGQSLYEAKITANPIIVTAHFKGKFGRIRDVVVGPDGYLYITTSNKDGRGIPAAGDDKIIRINPQKI
jgi:glucose/arabinose dehydrogenase